MSSRDRILAAIAQNQPTSVSLPELVSFGSAEENLTEKFIQVATGVGSKVFEVSSLEEIKTIIGESFPEKARIVSPIAEFADIAQTSELDNIDPHTLEDVELAIIRAHFAVAENSASWVTEELLPQRVLPFISQYLAVILSKKDIVPTMHKAYERIGAEKYGFAAFIAGPSKTADIEQSLVLGAHGPRGLMIFLMD